MQEGLKIEPVTDRKSLVKLIEFPFRLYRDDPNWVPPLIEERVEFFDHRKNPFFEHARDQLYLARRGDAIVGTIGAVVDDNHNQTHGEQTGMFGFFDTINDPDVAAALLGTAESWVRAQGMNCIRGPMNYSTNHEIGCLVDGYELPPMVMMTHNPRYYPALIEGQGYHKAMDVFAWLTYLKEDLEAAPAKLFHVAEQSVIRSGIKVREADLRNFRHEVEQIKVVYNQAWTKNWGFVPLTDHEIDHLAAGLKQIVDPHLILIADTSAGEPVGISLCLPDVHQALRLSGGGHYFPLGLAKFLWQRRKIDQCRVMVMGVIEEYRTKGIDAYFYVKTAQTARDRGYKRAESSWILESNTMMNTIIERMGGRRYKTYRIFEKSLA
jgi:GNAT superfamily N-acetyltransferase